MTLNVRERAEQREQGDKWHVKRVNEAVGEARDGATVGSGGGGSDRWNIHWVDTYTYFQQLVFAFAHSIGLAYSLEHHAISGSFPFHASWIGFILLYSCSLLFSLLYFHSLFFFSIITHQHLIAVWNLRFNFFFFFNFVVTVQLRWHVFLWTNTPFINYKITWFLLNRQWFLQTSSFSSIERLKS